MGRETSFVFLIWSIRCESACVDFTNVLKKIDEGFLGRIHRESDVVRVLK